MAQVTNITDENLLAIKRHLKITWNDEDTNNDVKDKMLDAIDKLNDLLGAEPDYFSPGSARELFKNYMLYAWNDCLNEFNSAYRDDILRVRHKYAIQRRCKNEE